MDLGALLLPVALVLLLVFLLYKLGTRNHGTLERLGIPVVPPLPFVGSTPQPWNTSAAIEDAKNARRFGKVWGAYEGPTPQVFINDPELAKRIFIKDFEHFADRPNIMDFESARDLLDLLKGDRWRTVRAVLSPPMASAAKLKAMMPTLELCAESACHRLDETLKKTSSVNLQRDLFGSLVLDVMSQFSFGIKFDDVGDPESRMVKEVSVMSSDPQMMESKVAGFMTFSPMLSNYVMSKFFSPVMRYCLSVLRTSIKQRRAEGTERADLVGVLIHAIDNKVPSEEFRRLNITEEVLMVQGAEMLMASYDTTALTLTSSAYYLATHPEVLERVVEEVRGVGELTYDSLSKLPLLEGVLNEAQRLCPLVSRHVRECVKDWEADGVRIPAGMHVLVPLTPYHMNPEAFPDPERFDPDRWLSEEGRLRAKDYYMPFGVGPRACIGQRLAIVECKFVLAYFLQRYKISATEKTKLVKCKGVNVMSLFYPIQVKVEKIE